MLKSANYFPLLAENLCKQYLRSLIVQVKNINTFAENEFKYTQNNSMLNLEQRMFYEINGYLFVKNLVDKQEIDKYIQRFKDIANRKVKPPFGMILQKEMTLVKEEQTENTVYKLQELAADEILSEYCKYEPILDYVECFCGPNQMAIHTMLINKPPDPGTKSSRHPLHQDLHYFPIRPADRIVCAWTAMETINRANGGLVAIPGTHTGKHLDHDYPDWEGGVNKFYYGVKSITGDEERIYLEMNAGDTVFFHPLLIHGSGANKTNEFRKAISCHYTASECNYIEVKGTIQEKLSQEIAKRYINSRIDDYILLWKSKSCLVRGKQINI